MEQLESLQLERQDRGKVLLRNTIQGCQMELFLLTGKKTRKLQERFVR